MIRRRAFLATCGALGAALLSRRAIAATAEVLASLRSARQRIRTLQARFEQERTLGLLATRVVSRGELTVVLPGQLRWELLPPDSITWWITPAGLAYASSRSRASADRSAAGPMAGVLDDVLVVLGGDPTRLEPRYALEAALQPDETVRVVATPKDSRISAVMRSIEILIDRDLISPRRIRMEESSSDRIEIRFSDVRINQPVDPARMRPPTEPRP